MDVATILALLSGTSSLSVPSSTLLAVIVESELAFLRRSVTTAGAAARENEGAGSTPMGLAWILAWACGWGAESGGSKMAER
jgi:hypothetical protein